ncbi:hypothetical protein VNO77_40946 [Canavalia gladiata]|uniref:Uncharacterized protein n=1 Tax=Canavalia gladiata TaxID=3824 RepID=A0AAN9K0A2_CANGL
MVKSTQYGPTSCSGIQAFIRRFMWLHCIKSIFVQQLLQRGVYLDATECEGEIQSVPEASLSTATSILSISVPKISKLLLLHEINRTWVFSERVSLMVSVYFYFQKSGLASKSGGFCNCWQQPCLILFSPLFFSGWDHSP